MNKLCFFPKMSRFSFSKFSKRDFKMPQEVNKLLQIKSQFLNKFKGWPLTTEFNLTKIFAIFLQNLFQKLSKSIRTFHRKV
jgi:hypothetical protein